MAGEKCRKMRLRARDGKTEKVVKMCTTSEKMQKVKEKLEEK